MGKILIIDDEKQMLALLSRILELEGYEVYRTATCKAGLRQLQVNTPEVVLRDVCLPDGNGIELIDRMKNISPSAEIILLTAHGKIEDSVSAIKSSAFDYLVKGDDNNRIFSLIAKEMEKAINERFVAQLISPVNLLLAYKIISTISGLSNGSPPLKLISLMCRLAIISTKLRKSSNVICS